MALTTPQPFKAISEFLPIQFSPSKITINSVRIDVLDNETSLLMVVNISNSGPNSVDAVILLKDDLGEEIYSVVERNIKPGESRSVEIGPIPFKVFEIPIDVLENRTVIDKPSSITLYIFQEQIFLLISSLLEHWAIY